MPILTKTFQGLGVELPLSTRILVGASNLLAQHFLLIASVMVVVVSGLVVWSRSLSGKKTFNFLFLHLPITAKLTQETNSAVMMRTLSSLIVSGVSMLDSLKITEKVLQNYYYKRTITKAGEAIQRGVALSTVVKEAGDIYPPLVSEMIEVGEETGNLSQMLTRGAVFYEEEVAQATKNLSSIVEPLIMVVIGIAVGFFAVSLIGPMYSLSSAIKI